MWPYLLCADGGNITLLFDVINVWCCFCGIAFDGNATGSIKPSPGGCIVARWAGNFCICCWWCCCGCGIRWWCNCCKDEWQFDVWIICFFIHTLPFPCCASFSLTAMRHIRQTHNISLINHKYTLNAKWQIPAHMGSTMADVKRLSAQISCLDWM